MHNLMEIQAKLKNAILGGEESLEFIKKNGAITTSDRIAVHQDTVFENFISSLKITYPEIWRLIGEDCARGVALAYSHDYANLTSRSEIDDFGESFPMFFASFPSTKHLQYLPDFANLELLRAKSYRAIKQESMPIEEIQSYFESGIESCKLLFNASIFFLHSEFPLMNIQALLNDPKSDELSLKKQECFIIVCRVMGRIETISLQKQQWQFLQNLSQGSVMGDIMSIFTEEEIATEMPAIINLLLSKKMIIKIQE